MNRLSLSRGNSKTEQHTYMLPIYDNFNEIYVKLSLITFFYRIQVDVVAFFPPNDNRELIPEVRVSLTENGNVDLVDLMNSLKFMGYPVEHKTVSYFSSSSENYQYCGTDPLPLFSTIPASEIAKNNSRSQVINIISLS